MFKCNEEMNDSYNTTRLANFRDEKPQTKEIPMELSPEEVLTIEEARAKFDQVDQGVPAKKVTKVEIQPKAPAGMPLAPKMQPKPKAPVPTPVPEVMPKKVVQPVKKPVPPPAPEKVKSPSPRLILIQFCQDCMSRLYLFLKQ